MSDNPQLQQVNFPVAPVASITPAYPAPLGGLPELIAAATADREDDEHLDGFSTTSLGCQPFVDPTGAGFELIIVDEAHHHVDVLTVARSKAASRHRIEAALRTIGDSHRSLALMKPQPAGNYAAYVHGLMKLNTRGPEPREEQK